MLLYERLKSLRQAKGVTVAQVSLITGLSVSYLYDLERGRTLPSLQALALLADCYNYQVHTLLATVDLWASIEG